MIIVALICAVYGAVLSRMCGGGLKPLPHGLNEWLYAVPFGIVCLPTGMHVALMAYLFAVLGKRTGHGGGMDLGHSSSEPGAGREPEKLEYIILWLHGLIPQYWYDAILLALTGLLMSAPAGILLLAHGYNIGLIVAFIGLAKPLAYMAGWAAPALRLTQDIDEATEYAELAEGFIIYFSLSILIFGVL